MLKCDCNFIEITLRQECSPETLLHIFIFFRTPFPKNISRRMLVKLLLFLIEYFLCYLIEGGRAGGVQASTLKLSSNRNNELYRPTLSFYLSSEAVVQKCSVKKVFKIHRKTPGPKPKACNFIKKETLAQVFSCEFCEISKNIFFHKTPLVAASDRLVAQASSAAMSSSEYQEVLIFMV